MGYETEKSSTPAGIAHLLQYHYRTVLYGNARQCPEAHATDSRLKCIATLLCIDIPLGVVGMHYHILSNPNAYHVAK